MTQLSARVLSARLFRASLRLYPAGFRAEFGVEMTDVFSQQLSAVAAGGQLAVARLVARECVGAAGQALRERAAFLQSHRALVAQTSAGPRVWGPGRRATRVLLFAGLLTLGLALAWLAWLAYAIATIGFERPPRVQQIALADLTGNGHLDAYLAIGPGGEPYQHPDYVLFGQGQGVFIDSGQELGNFDSLTVALGDLDGDGLIDAVEGGRVRWNYGQGMLGTGTYQLQDFFQGATHRIMPVLADLNGDGSLDVFGAACCGGGISGAAPEPLFAPDLVALNDGRGIFRNNRQALADTGSYAAAVGDLNGDGAPDAFVAGALIILPDMRAESGAPNTVWFNDGRGNFRDSGQRLGNMYSMAVALGDLNGDSFLDAVVGNRGADEVWFNDGQGVFTDSGQRLGDGPTRHVYLADLNADGWFDLLAVGDSSARIWLNDGAGRLRASQRITLSEDSSAVIGDLMGDGRPHILVAGVSTYQVWLNAGRGRFEAGPLTAYR